MKVLGIDTSASRGSIAIAEVGQSINILSEATWSREKSHSELVTVTVERALADAGIALRDLEAVAVGVGPGSFTGVRVGVNVARTLAYTLRIPIWQSDSLHAWARPLWHEPLPLLVAVYGFRDLIYTTFFDRPSTSGQRTVTWPSTMQTIGQLTSHLPTQDLVVAGDALNKLSDQWPESFRGRIRLTSEEPPLARHLFQPLVEADAGQKRLSWENVKPLYIRGSEAEEKLRQGLLRPLPKV